jgi:hypothetical protein
MRNGEMREGDGTRDKKGNRVSVVVMRVMTGSF